MEELEHRKTDWLALMEQSSVHLLSIYLFVSSNNRSCGTSVHSRYQLSHYGHIKLTMGKLQQDALTEVTYSMENCLLHALPSTFLQPQVEVRKLEISSPSASSLGRLPMVTMSKIVCRATTDSCTLSSVLTTPPCSSLSESSSSVVEGGSSTASI